MIRVAALTPGRNVASSLFRVRQNMVLLKEKGVEVKEYPARIPYNSKLPGAAGRIRQRWIFPVSAAWLGIKALSRLGDLAGAHFSEFIWLNRIFVNPLYTEFLLRKPLVYDIDDALWLSGHRLFTKIASGAEVVMAGNTFIADYLSKFNPNIEIIPTAIDADAFSPRENPQREGFSIVWTGSSDTIHYLLSVEKPLADFLYSKKDAKLIVVSDKNPLFREIEPEKLEFVPWTVQNEIEAIRKASAGIMPLSDTDWERGKCSFKMLKYMSCAIPVVVSPVGMNREVLDMGSPGFAALKDPDWTGRLDDLYRNPGLAEQMGREGRRIILGSFSTEIISSRIASVFHRL